MSQASCTVVDAHDQKRDVRLRGRAGDLALALVALAIWETAGRFELVASGALPAPSAILAALWRDRLDYPAHVGATLHGAGAGFLIGNALAIAAGVLFTLSPSASRLARGVNIALFSLPPIAVAPIFALTLSGMAPRIALAALGCYFVTMTATVLGLSRFDSRGADVVRAYGGGRMALLRHVQARGALPVVLSGLRIAAPNAVLGAILAEFGGGGRWGLGTYLLGSLGRGEPARLWGIGLVATAIAGLGYLAFALAASRTLGSTLAVSLDVALPDAQVDARTESAARRALVTLGTVALPLLLWWALISLPDLPSLIARTPAGVVDYLFLADSSGASRARLIAALGETLPITVAGLALGMAVAFALAVGTRLFPRALRLLLPLALVTQTMPLVALTPLLVLLLGRGTVLMLCVTASVTFFPAFVTLAQGLALVPTTVVDVARAYGASGWRRLRLVTLPAAVPYLFAAARLAAPRALLGVMIAEWLATGTGLGNLLNRSRGTLDYGMVWAVAAVSVLVAIGFHAAVVAVERRVLARMGMAAGVD